MSQPNMDSLQFVKAWNWMQTEVHQTARRKGWWESRDALVNVTSELEKGDIATPLTEFATITNQLSAMMLMVTEIAEAVEGIRHGNPPDDKIPDFSAAEAECADVAIRMMDLAEACGWDIAGAIVAKAQMNKGRPYMHGGKKA